MQYERFRLESQPAPPLYRPPHPFEPRVKKLRLAHMLLKEAISYGVKLRHGAYRKALLSRPCIYGVFDGRLGGFRPIKEKCTGCMRCVQEYPEICTVERNPEFFSFGDSYWLPEDPSTASTTPISTVGYEASTGKIPVKGMGYKGSFTGPGWDSMWTDMSEIVRPTRDGVYGREFISTVVDIGKKPDYVRLNDEGWQTSSKIVEAPLPIVFDYLPPNLSNLSIRKAIAEASRKLGIFFIASPADGLQEAKGYSQHLIPLVSSSSLEQYSEIVSRAKIVEFEFDRTPSYRRVRELNPSAILSLRIALTESAEETSSKLVAARDIDVLHLCADYHGREYEVQNPRFVKDALHVVHTRLVKDSLRDQVTIIASGGITLAEHVPKAIICGADLVALDTTILVALQAKFEGQCITPEKGRIKSYSFDPMWGAQRLVNLVTSWHDQLIEILSAMGMRDARRLRGDIGRAMFNEELEKEAFGDTPHIP